ncbi:unnamed protein product [Brassica oleracea var. botrytis]
MAIRTRRIFSFVFAMIMSIMVLSGFCSARVYKVGDSEGWTAKDDVYYSWAETDYKEFHVGDSLVFEYNHIINDVTHVSGALEYELCDYSFPKAVYNTVHDAVTLTEPVLVVRDPSRPVPPPQPTKILLSEISTKSETQKDGKSTIATFIISGVRRNSFMLEMVCFSNTPTTSTKSAVI